MTPNVENSRPATGAGRPRIGELRPSWKTLANLVDATTEALASHTLTAPDMVTAVENAAWAATRMERWQSYVAVVELAPAAAATTPTTGPCNPHWLNRCIPTSFPPGCHSGGARRIN